MRSRWIMLPSCGVHGQHTRATSRMVRCVPNCGVQQPGWRRSEIRVPAFRHSASKTRVNALMASCGRQGKTMPEIKITFDAADDYERYMGRWSRSIGERFLAWLGAPKGARWLDLGCGTGAFSARSPPH